MKYSSTHIRQTLLIDKDNLAVDAQVGIDLTVCDIKEIVGGAIIDDKTHHGEFNSLNSEGNYWYLSPGAYQVTFDQGLKTLSSTENATIIQRSSLNRNGVRVQGSIYDPGFGCDNLGATLYAAVPISIMRHARIAQLVVETNEDVEANKLYNGQFQGVAN